MNLRHIEIFHAIMQTGSVTGAAHMLNVTQPSISNVLRHAEQQLGFRLFERISGRLQPTTEACELLPDVEEIFGRIETLKRMLEEMKGGKTSRLAIAASPTLVNAYLPKALALLETLGTQITIQSLPTALAIERVARREVDVGLVYGPVVNPGVIEEPLSQSQVVCVVNRNSALANHKLLTPQDLANTAVVSTGPTTHIGTAIKETCEAHELPIPQTTVEVNSSMAACLMAAEDVGIALVDLASVGQLVSPNVVLIPFRPQVCLHVSLIFPRNRPQSRAAARVAQALRTLAATE